MASAIRGSRVGAAASAESDRGKTAPSQSVSYFCQSDHETVLQFALDAELPVHWDCRRCGQSAAISGEDRPVSEEIAPFKTHLAYAKERRNEADAKELLNEALVDLRRKRKSGEIIF